MPKNENTTLSLKTVVFKDRVVLFYGITSFIGLVVFINLYLKFPSIRYSISGYEAQRILYLKKNLNFSAKLKKLR